MKSNVVSFFSCKASTCWLKTILPVFYSCFYILTLWYLILSSASSSNGSAPVECSDGQSGSDTPVRTPASGSSSAPETSPLAGSDRNSTSASGAAATRQPTSSTTPAAPPRVPAVNAGPLPPGSALMLLSLQKGWGMIWLKNNQKNVTNSS